MCTKKTANCLTVIGTSIGIAALAVTPVGWIGAIGIPIARGLRAILDKQREENETREEEPVNNFPVLSRDRTPFYPSYPFSGFGASLEEPESTLARINPGLAYKALIRKSDNDLLGTVANSSVATEFARQGRGTRFAMRKQKSWLTDGETTEIAIWPI
ncbi:MAG: hypothetical protein AAB503_00895 [Patescibacteria group bacterium]